MRLKDGLHLHQAVDQKVCKKVVSYCSDLDCSTHICANSLRVRKRVFIPFAM